ncbi:hypothetical protein [Rivibacter subsaxonicus]|uniref:Uncharacterized protein n=1 Tax=Rivibacter subsaxonicus TaxID=457575 RepID=A0A4Q7VNJ2_9BURK|nr:hypothetical protein [Rivibacter subsaxonicus]RZT97882.1 hypothetical protein EV670_2282 [Rivibacter subsaxonicus]
MSPSDLQAPSGTDETRAEPELGPLAWEPGDGADLGPLLRTAEPAAPQALEDTELIDSRVDFHAAIRAALQEASDAGASELWLCDPDFSGWPLGERSIVELLAGWIDSRRRLTLVAAHYDWLALNAPRFIAWRRQWSHVVDCLIAHVDDAPRLPSLLLWPDHLQLRLSDAERMRGRSSRSATDLTASAELIDAAVQRAEGNFAATTLGL